MSLAQLRRSTNRALASNRISTAPSIGLTPERSMEIQALLGSDIHMVLDECTPFPSGARDTEGSMELSMRWPGVEGGIPRRARRAFRHRSGRCSIPICGPVRPRR